MNPRDITTKNVQFWCVNSALKISEQELKSNAKQRWIVWFPQSSPIVLSEVQDDKSLYISLVFLHQPIKIRNTLPCKETKRSTRQMSELNIDSIWRKGLPPQSKDLRGIWNSTTSLLKMPNKPSHPYPRGIQALLKPACVATNPIWQYQIWFLLAESITGHQSWWFKRVLIEPTDFSAQLKRSKS